MSEQSGIQLAPIFAGILIILVFFSFQFLPIAEENTARLVIGTLSISVRVLAFGWVHTLAKKQGRKEIIYALAAILFPSLMLIAMGIIGNNKKRNS